MKELVTIVTAFVDIGRGEWFGVKNDHVIAPYIKRDTETYLQRFERLTKLKNPIVCFTQSRFFERIQSMREDIVLVNIDNLFQDNEHLLKSISKAQSNPYFLRYVRSPSSPEYWSPEYVAINFLKSHLTTYAVENGLCHSTTTAWVDFGYCRDEVYCPPGKTFTYSVNDKINLFGMGVDFTSRPVFDLVLTGDVLIQGCHIIAPNKEWKVLKQLVNDSLAVLLKVGMIDDDQTLLLMSLRADPDRFKIIPGNPNNWFILFEGNCDD